MEFVKGAPAFQPLGDWPLEACKWIQSTSLKGDKKADNVLCCASHMVGIRHENPFKFKNPTKPQYLPSCLPYRSIRRLPELCSLSQWQSLIPPLLEAPLYMSDVFEVPASLLIQLIDGLQGSALTTKGAFRICMQCRLGSNKRRAIDAMTASNVLICCRLQRSASRWSFCVTT